MNYKEKMNGNANTQRHYCKKCGLKRTVKMNSKLTKCTCEQLK